MTPERAPALLTVAEAAATMKCSKRRVFELIAAGTLVRGPKFGKHTVVLAESVFDALEKAYDPPPPPKRKRIRGGRGTFAARCDAWSKEARGR